MTDLIDALEQSSMVSYIVDGDYQINYCNPAWDRFALENDAPELIRTSVLGLDLRSVLGKDLRSFYTQALEGVEKSGRVWDWLYECSTPEVFRKFHMRVHSISSPKKWFLFTNALVIEHRHTASATGSLNNYLNSNSDITMCSHCRRSRRGEDSMQWDFVPAHLERGVFNVTHSLCPVCLEYFYPKPVDDTIR